MGQAVTPPWLLDEVQHVIIAAVDREAEEVCRRLERIGVEGGAPAMFSACVAWAKAAAVLSGMDEAVSSGRADGVAMRPINGQQIDESSPATFAARFFVAVTNNDIDMAHDLFAASTADVEYHQMCVVEVVKMVGDFGRIKQEQVAAERRTERRRRQGRNRPPKRRGRR